MQRDSKYMGCLKLRELTFGIIGFGKMGKIRLKTLNEMDGCTVKWVCDINRETASNGDTRFTVNEKDVLEDEDIDAIIVSTSNDRLKDLVVKFLDRGKHVFCEKPPGRNMVELNEMIEAESRNPKLKLMFGFNHRHHESVIRAKQVVDSGEYGSVLWMRGRYGKSVDKDFFSSWRARREVAGGGIFLDQGIHMLDLFLMMCDDFEEVKAHVSNLYWNLDIEDNVFAIFANKKGQVASLHSTMTQWRHIFSLEIFLERGYIVLNGLKTSSNTYGDEILTIARNRSLPPAARWTDEEKLVFHVDSSWKKEMNVFVDAIRNGKEISVGSTKDAFKLMRLVEKVYNEQ